MKRRSFLAIAGGVTAIAAGSMAVARKGTSSALGYQLSRLEGFGLQAATRLRYHYRWLDVEPAAFASYVSDYQRYFGRLDRFSIPPRFFFTQFLLSTNFFAAARRTDQRVAYTIFYAPGVSPCYNPLAQPPPSNAELGMEAVAD